MKEFSKDLKLAIKAALSAGKAIMEIYESEDFELEVKEDFSPLTKADKTAHKVIDTLLSYSSLPILSEEGPQIPYEQRRKWNRFWMLDPIDGTKEFIKRNGEFTVNVALIEDRMPILGVVYAPALKDLYFAEIGVGSFKVEGIKSLKRFNKKNFIDLSKSIYPETYTLVVSKSHMNVETQNFVYKKEKELGTIAKSSFGSSLKICKVAEGKAHCYPRFGPTMEWDTAAAHAVVTFAKLSIKQINGSPLTYNKKNLLNPYFLVTNE